MNDLKWEQMKRAVVRYYYKFGNLCVPRQYVTGGDWKFGEYIAYKRRRYRCNENYRYISKEDIKFLEKYGMVWDLKILEKLSKKYEDVNFIYLLHLRKIVELNQGLINPSLLKEHKDFYRWYLYVLRYGNAFMCNEHKKIWVDIYQTHIRYQQEMKHKQKIALLKMHIL